jgi:hypothetical protein
MFAVRTEEQDAALGILEVIYLGVEPSHFHAHTELTSVVLLIV